MRGEAAAEQVTHSLRHDDHGGGHRRRRRRPEHAHFTGRKTVGGERRAHSGSQETTALWLTCSETQVAAIRRCDRLGTRLGGAHAADAGDPSLATYLATATPSDPAAMRISAVPIVPVATSSRGPVLARSRSRCPPGGRPDGPGSALPRLVRDGLPTRDGRRARAGGGLGTGRGSGLGGRFGRPAGSGLTGGLGPRGWPTRPTCGADPPVVVGAVLISAVAVSTAVVSTACGQYGGDRHGLGPGLGRSWSCPVTRARSASTAACIRCRNSEDIGGDAEGAPPLASAPPRTRCGSCCSVRSSSPIVKPQPLARCAHGKMRTAWYSGAQDRRLFKQICENVTAAIRFVREREDCRRGWPDVAGIVSGSKSGEIPSFEGTCRYRLVCGVCIRPQGAAESHQFCT